MTTDYEYPGAGAETQDDDPRAAAVTFYTYRGQYGPGGEGIEGHTHSLESLSDVTIVNVLDNQALLYDEPSKSWLNQSVTGGVSSVFSRIGDVIALAGDYVAFYAALVHQHVLADITDSGAMAAEDDAPDDGLQYVRKSLAWAVATGGGAVDSVFGRTGAVIALVGDYASFYASLVHQHLLADITDSGAMAAEDDAPDDAQEYVRKSLAWEVATGGGGSGDGDVTGPDDAVDSNLAAFDGITGKVIKDGGVSAGSFPLISADDTLAAQMEHAFVAALPGTPDPNTIYFLEGGVPPGAGDVVGPDGVTDGALSSFDGASGKLIQDGDAPVNGLEYVRKDLAWAVATGGGGGGDVFGPTTSFDLALTAYDGTTGKLILQAPGIAVGGEDAAYRDAIKFLVEDPDEPGSPAVDLKGTIGPVIDKGLGIDAFGIASFRDVLLSGTAWRADFPGFVDGRYLVTGPNGAVIAVEPPGTIVSWEDTNATDVNLLLTPVEILSFTVTGDVATGTFFTQMLLFSIHLQDMTVQILVNGTPVFTDVIPVMEVTLLQASAAIAAGLTNGDVVSVEITASNLEANSPQVRGASLTSIARVAYTVVGDVIGPDGGVVDAEIAVFDSATGKAIKSSGGELVTGLPFISSEDTLAGRMQMAVVATLPGTPDANTIYFIPE